MNKTIINILFYLFNIILAGLTFHIVYLSIKYFTVDIAQITLFKMYWKEAILYGVVFIIWEKLLKMKFR